MERFCPDLSSPTSLILHHNSSSRPNPVERDASRDPECFEFQLTPWIPGLAPQARPALDTGLGSPGKTVFSNCDTAYLGGDLDAFGIASCFWIPDLAMHSIARPE